MAKSLLSRAFAPENILNWLLIFVPAAVVLEIIHAGALYIFITASLAIIPLAGWMGKATEHLAESMGEGPGGLLNATFGNAAEMIIAIIALNAGLYEVVKASVTGSIIGNILLVFGISLLAGGLKYPLLRFNQTAASLATTMLTLGAGALVIPAIFHAVARTADPGTEHELSLEISVILILTYLLSLVFALRTHKHLYSGDPHAREAHIEKEPGAEAMGTVGWSRSKSLSVLVGATILVAVMGEFLVGAIEETAQQLGMTEVFVGVILIAIIGNAAEHSTAILMAIKNKMDLSINIAVGSSLQIALFVAPVLVFLSYVIGPQPMDLLFTTFEVVAVVFSVLIISFIAHDGESNWMEGVQLLAVYLILAVAFYLLPA